ncbi:MAG TPA: hypothetical protein VHS31_01380, partial [Tepidisphaeraceae bacterium]|nr:hypothetical protein [Tepidisphaeraceae bacterium]
MIETTLISFNAILVHLGAKDCPVRFHANGSRMVTLPVQPWSRLMSLPGIEADRTHFVMMHRFLLLAQ